MKKIILLSFLSLSFLFASDNSATLDKIVKAVKEQKASNIDFSKFDKEVNALLDKLKDSNSTKEQEKIESQAKKYYENFVQGMSTEEKNEVLNHLQSLILDNQDTIKKLILENQDTIKALSPKLKESLKSLQVK